MSRLTIQLKRLRDGGAALTCTRPDGSVVWQRQTGSHGAVFPTHDLTHFAVETTLSYKHAFYGLLASGWEFSDFAAPFPKGEIPEEARAAELIVSLFEIERRIGATWSPDEFREQGRLYVAAQQSRGKKAVMPTFTDAEIEQIRVLLRELLARWSATKEGETLELHFNL